MKAFLLLITVALVGAACKQALAEQEDLEQCLGEVETSFKSLESPKRIEKLAQDLKSVPYEKRFNNQTGKSRAFEMKLVRASEKRSIERLCWSLVNDFEDIVAQTDCEYELNGAIDPWINVNGYTEIAQKYPRISKIVDSVQACIDIIPILRNKARSIVPCLREASLELAGSHKIPYRFRILAEELINSGFKSQVFGAQKRSFILEEAKKFDGKLFNELTELCPIYGQEIFDTITSTECGTRLIDWTEYLYGQFDPPKMIEQSGVSLFERMKYLWQVCKEIEGASGISPANSTIADPLNEQSNVSDEE